MFGEHRSLVNIQFLMASTSILFTELLGWPEIRDLDGAELNIVKMSVITLLLFILIHFYFF